MKLFYDLRLGYLVAAPGQDTALSELQAKAGDEEEVIVQFGRSSDPTSSTSILTAPTWTAENLAGGTVITIGIKEDGKYSDGDILASTSTFSHNSGDKLYTFDLDLNTTEINTLLERLDANDADDVASADCQFEITFQVGGAGGWRSSVLPVPLTLYHDVLGGAEGTPTNAADPDEYLLKSDGIEFLTTVSSRTGGTAADFDSVATTTRDVNTVVAFYDTDPAVDEVKHYRLTAGTDAESDPDTIRPDDFHATTNQKVWKLLKIAGSAGVAGGTGSTDNAILRADGTGGNTVQSSGITIADGATGALSGSNSGDVTIDSTTSDVLSITGQLITADDPGADRIIFWDDSASGLKHLTVGSGLSISGTTITATGSTYAGAPVGTITYSANTSFGSSDKGKMILLDTSGGAVDLSVPNSGVAADDYFWVMQTDGANAGSLTRSSTALYNSGTDADIAVLGAGNVYLVWYQTTAICRILSIN